MATLKKGTQNGGDKSLTGSDIFVDLDTIIRKNQE